MPVDPETAGLELEAGGYMILAFIALGILGYVAYEVYELGGTISDALSNLWDELSSATNKATQAVSDTAGGLSTYIPGTTAFANVNTPPPTPAAPGLPAGYNPLTGQIDGSPGGASGSF